MKIMSKVKIIRKNSIKNVLNEKSLLSKLHNPFLVNMVFSFQDVDNLYLIMDLLLGGDLRYHLNKHEVFNENHLKFFIACTISGLDYLHSNNIIHKDIKPENLVFDNKGYLHITDLGISKIYHEENKKENSGTPGYMAPEVLFNKNHNYSVDFFALGVIGYEIIMGTRPYKGKDKKELRKDIISRQARLKEDDINIMGWSKLCLEFINGLLQRKKESRLGKGGIKELMEHPWFFNFEWDELLKQKMEASWKPNSGENYYHDLTNEDEIGKETEQCYEEIKNRIEYSRYFEDYSFNFNEVDLNNNKENNNNSKEKRKELNKKMKLKYEMTSRIINKLKQEIKKFTFPNNKINPIDKRNNSLYKTPLRFINVNTRRTDYGQNIKSSLRLTKSYYLYNNNLKTSSKLHMSNDSFINNNFNTNGIYNLSTKYNNKEAKTFLNEKNKINNKSNDSKNFYKSNYNSKFFAPSGYKFNSGFKLNFNAVKKYLYFDKMVKNQLPVIKQLKKSSSVGNLDRIKFNKKTKLTIDNGNNPFQNNLVNL